MASSWAALAASRPPPTAMPTGRRRRWAEDRPGAVVVKAGGSRGAVAGSGAADAPQSVLPLDVWVRIAGLLEVSGGSGGGGGAEGDGGRLFLARRLQLGMGWLFFFFFSLFLSLFLSLRRFRLKKFDMYVWRLEQRSAREK